ncbi:MAG: NAD(P)-binding domain-containing protein [Bacteroidales bacterium]|nr:NAD(P)-binding domain-containing protein [Bacteroidales bacterium]
MKIGFIGTGKIASAVINGICTSDMEHVDIYVSPRNEEKSKHLAEIYPIVHRMNSNQLVLDQADIVFIALIPNQVRGIIEDLNFKEDHIVVSLIPYTRLSELSEILYPARTISRAIPLPTVVHHNCPIPVFNSNSTVKDIFGHIGQPLIVDTEDQLHALWTLTGLIAPYYELLEELSDWATSKGVEKEVSDRYVADMFYALSNAACNSKTVNFKHHVTHATTPKGMNEQAGIEIRQKGAHTAYRDAADNLLKRFPD